MAIAPKKISGGSPLLSSPVPCSPIARWTPLLSLSVLHASAYTRPLLDMIAAFLSVWSRAIAHHNHDGHSRGVEVGPEECTKHSGDFWMTLQVLAFLLLLRLNCKRAYHLTDLLRNSWVGPMNLDEAAWPWPNMPDEAREQTQFCLHLALRTGFCGQLQHGKERTSALQCSDKMQTQTRPW